MKYLKRSRAGSLGSGRSASRPHTKRKMSLTNVGEFSRSNQKPHASHPPSARSAIEIKSYCFLINNYCWRRANRARPFCLRVVYNLLHDLRFTSVKWRALKPRGATTKDSIQYCPHFYVLRFLWFLLKSWFWTTLHHFSPGYFCSRNARLQQPLVFLSKTNVFLVAAWHAHRLWLLTYV